MSAPTRYTLTAALPYTNGPIHIGHLAGVYVPADIYARFQRGKGADVAFICGSDEHGAAIAMRATQEGTTPQAIIDKYDGIIRKSFEDFGITFDNYSRTSRDVHHKTAQAFFTKLNDAGKFEEKVTEQLYDPEANQFLADRFVIGTCPNCAHEEAYGDQCEKCGRSLDATDLIDPKSKLTGATPVIKTTNHWYLPLGDYTGFLKDWILHQHKDDWKPNVYGQCKSWIEDGLRDRAVTRDIDWGIPVPVDGADGKVLYVWFDAPIGYISSTKEWAARENKDWEPYWKDENTKMLHFIGKDNIVFHCIIFPSMLHAHGDYILPDNVPANEFLNLEGNKLSTSKNWAVWLHEYLEEFPGQQDVLRYALTANAPETKDNDFTWKDFQARNNNELVAIYGNFINRVMVLTHKYYDGVIPAAGTLQAVDMDALAQLSTIKDSIEESVERYRFRESVSRLMEVARLGNKYLADEEPWKQVKTDPDRTKAIMNTALQIAGVLAVLSEPFLPHTSQKLRAMLRLDQSLTWNDMPGKDILPAGHTVGASELLFSQIEDSTIQAQLDKLEKTKVDNQAKQDAEVAAQPKTVEPQKPETDFDTWSQMDLRTGTILKAEKMPKADRLLILEVDTGIDTRTIVSGIAESFTPEEVVGRQVTVLCNLAPRKLRGVISQGMILMTDDENGKLVFVNPDRDGVTNGSVIS